ncbi:MAG: hypothetical protein FJW30_09725 [Acidobacteria bacterium]|nr:hypothetical protein [Acidobacteriota bacterium]
MPRIAPARRRYPHLWSQTLRDAGLRDVQAKSFLDGANPPFDKVQTEYLRYHLARKSEWNIPNEDKRTLLDSRDSASPRYVKSGLDLHYLSVSTP